VGLLDAGDVDVPRDEFRYSRHAGEGAGAIVTTGSISGMFSEPALAAYTASKAAIVNLTRSLAIDLASSGIRVNCVCPGWVDTGLNHPQFAHDSLREEDIASLIRRTFPRCFVHHGPDIVGRWRPAQPRVGSGQLRRDYRVDRAVSVVATSLRNSAPLACYSNCYPSSPRTEQP
jgi:NAD(P)-dependent dehydrogenase (short-subunit alcohol dehydrogenase family)